MARRYDTGVPWRRGKLGQVIALGRRGVRRRPSSVLEIAPCATLKAHEGHLSSEHFKMTKCAKGANGLHRVRERASVIRASAATTRPTNTGGAECKVGRMRRIESIGQDPITTPRRINPRPSIPRRRTMPRLRFLTHQSPCRCPRTCSGPPFAPRRRQNRRTSLGGYVATSPCDSTRQHRSAAPPETLTPAPPHQSNAHRLPAVQFN